LTRPARSCKSRPMTRRQDRELEVKETSLGQPMPVSSHADMSCLAAVRISTDRQSPRRSRRTPRPASEQQSNGPQAPRVRLTMPHAEVQLLAELLSSRPTPRDEQRLLDQLWLRTVLVEQQRQIRRNERGEFRIRADRLLEALDPSRSTPAAMEAPALSARQPNVPRIR